MHRLQAVPTSSACRAASRSSRTPSTRLPPSAPPAPDRGRRRTRRPWSRECRLSPRVRDGSRPRSHRAGRAQCRDRSRRRLRRASARAARSRSNRRSVRGRGVAPGSTSSSPVASSAMRGRRCTLSVAWFIAAATARSRSVRRWPFSGSHRPDGNRCRPCGCGVLRGRLR